MGKKQTDEQMTLEMKKAENEAEKEWQKLKGEEIEVYAPTLNLRQIFEDEGKDSMEIVIEQWAKPIGWVDEKTKEAKATMVMLVNYEGETRSLWLSAESLRRSIMAIYQRFGEEAMGMGVIITRRPYQNKEYGKTFAYNCQIIASEDEHTEV